MITSGLVFPTLSGGLFAGGGVAHHLYALAGGEDGLEAFPEHGVVVREVHSDGHSCSPSA
jgi:hypothetical protein